MPSEAELARRERFIERFVEGLSGPDRRVFSEFVVRRSLSTIGSRFNYAKVLGDLKRFRPKPWTAYTEADLVEFVSSLQGRLSTRTIALYKCLLKSFFSWLSRAKNIPNPAHWIRVSSKETAPRVTRDELITPEEFEKMLRAADSVRDKALLFTLWEAGLRLSMRVKDVEVGDSLIRISVKGKTGHRVVPLIASAPYIQQWLEAHPRRGEPEAPLWVSFKRGHLGEPLRETGVQKLLETVARRAGISKRVYPHLFRHSRATQLASQIRESILKQMFGWTQSSRMAAAYLHLSGVDVENSMKELYGIKSEEVRPEARFKPRPCPRCGAINTYDALYCIKCSLVLDAEEAMRRINSDAEKRKELECRLAAVEKALQISEGIIDALVKKFPDLIREIGLEEGNGEKRPV